MPTALRVDATNGSGLGLAIAALSLCACGGLVSSGSGGPSVSGNWIAEPAIGALGLALARGVGARLQLSSARLIETRARSRPE